MCIIVVKLCAGWTNYLNMQLLTCRFSWSFSLKADLVTSDRAACPYLQQVYLQNVFPLRDLEMEPLILEVRTTLEKPT